jgi:serine/threonine-protein kinase
MDARERFLNPDAMTLPRQINSNISLRTERAILWAMGLHPNERPQTVEEFRQALLGDYIPSTRTHHTKPLVKARDFLKTKPEKYLLYAAGALFGISLLVTLMH